MAPAQPSSPPPLPPSPWRASLATVLRRIARAVAPPAPAPRASVSQSPEPAERPAQLPPPGVHPAAGNGASQAAETTVVDPLARARAALRDARRHMTVLMDAEPPAAAPTAPPPAPAPAVRDAEPLRELLAELREERRALLSEIAGMRTLLLETRAEVAALRHALRDRLAEVQALQPLPPAAPEPALAPPAPSLTELIADAGDADSGASDDARDDQEPDGEQHAIAPAAAEAGAPAQGRFEPLPDWAPFRDFGWRVRPEASLDDAVEADTGAEAGSAEPAMDTAATGDPLEQAGASPDSGSAALEPAERSAVNVESPAEQRTTATPAGPEAVAAGAAAGATEPLRAGPRISDFAPIMPPPAPPDESEEPQTAQEATQAPAHLVGEAPVAPSQDEAASDARAGEVTAESVSGAAPAPEPAEAPSPRAEQDAEPGAGQDEDTDGETEPLRLPAGSTRLVIGPVRSIGRLTALERRLVREPVLAQVTLADFRRQLATIVVSARTAIDVAALVPALSDEERLPVAAAWQADGTLLVTLGKRAEDGA